MSLKLTILAMFTAVSLIIFIIESQFPPLAPIPGIKLGLANIITLLLLVWFGWREAFAVLILRIGLGSIFAGQIMSLMYSLAGGLLCFIVMSVCMRFFKKDGIWITSVFGAIAHNIGQITAAVLLTSTLQVAAYLPVLIISGVITGAFTGIAARCIVRNKALSKLAARWDEGER